MRAIRLTPAQVSALEIYCTDPAHDEPEAEMLRRSIRGRLLSVRPDEHEAIRVFLCDRSNAVGVCEDERWAERSLTSVYVRLCALTA